MHILDFLVGFLALSCLSGTLAQKHIPRNSENSYRYEEALDKEGKYRIEWNIDWTENKIQFNIRVETLGWIGFGLNKNPEMAGADIVMGGIDSNGNPYFTDMHATVSGKPPKVDNKQNWILHGAWESETHTSLNFSRKLDTCDNEDYPLINDDTVYLIWSYGETDDISKYHGKNRGGVPRLPLLRNYVPKGFNALLGDYNLTRKFAAESNLKLWSIENTFKIPPKRTTYWCKLHKLELQEKNHIIGFSMNIDNITKPLVHHMLFFRCVDPDSTLFEPFVGHPGEECYTQLKVSHGGKLPFRSCVELKLGYAIGGLPVFFNHEGAIPIGMSGSAEYYMQQIHYDNQEERDGLISENRLDMFYTSKLMESDAGLLSQGHHIPGSPSILLPPNSVGHEIFGHCSDTCTRKMFPLQGIKIGAVLLHSHTAGRRLALLHFRNGKELKPIIQDDNYAFTFQPVRYLRESVSVLPGDHLVMRCHFDTDYTNKTTTGGYSTSHEMCKAFIGYYNLLENYPLCLSEIISQDYNNKYLAGAMNFTWEEDRLEVVANAPPHLKGMSVGEISDSEYVDWTQEQRESLKEDHYRNIHYNDCPTTQEVAVAAILNAIPPPFPTKHPMSLGAIPYTSPPRKCCGFRR